MVVIFWNHHHAIWTTEGTVVTYLSRTRLIKAFTTDPVFSLLLLLLSVLLFRLGGLFAGPRELFYFFFYTYLLVIGREQVLLSGLVLENSFAAPALQVPIVFLDFSLS